MGFSEGEIGELAKGKEGWSEEERGELWKGKGGN